MIIHIWLQNMFMCEKCERWKKLDDTKEIDENEKKKYGIILKEKRKQGKRDIHTVWKTCIHGKRQKVKKIKPRKEPENGNEKME